MNKTKKYINLILEVVLVLSIMLAVLAIFVKGTVLNKNTYLTILNENGTYGKVKESIYDKIDKVLGANNIDNDIKESILTEEDIKKEADVVITGFIQYLKTGENDIPPIDTEVYKERTKDILNAIMDNLINPYKNDVSFNDSVEPTNLSYVEGPLQFNNMVVVKNQSQSGQDLISTEKLMTSSEAEQKVRALLKEKGLTEAQARQKMIEKGISKEQALKILAGYGITVDDTPQTGGNKTSSNGTSSDSVTNSNSQSQTSETATNNQNQASGTSDNNQNSVVSDNGETEQGVKGDNNQNSLNANNQENESGDSSGISSIKKLQEEIINVITTNDGTSIEEKLINVENKLLEEAGARIDNEIQKINLNKLMESSIVQKIAKIISIFDKMFWLFMILPVILILILIQVNDRKLYSSLRWIGNGFMLSGLFLLAASFVSYTLKIYESININNVYFKDIIPSIAKHLLINLSTSAAVILAIGLILIIPTIKRSIIKNTKN